MSAATNWNPTQGRRLAAFFFREGQTWPALFCIFEKSTPPSPKVYVGQRLKKTEVSPVRPASYCAKDWPVVAPYHRPGLQPKPRNAAMASVTGCRSPTDWRQQ